MECILGKVLFAPPRVTLRGLSFSNAKVSTQITKPQDMTGQSDPFVEVRRNFLKDQDPTIGPNQPLFLFFVVL